MADVSMADESMVEESNDRPSYEQRLAFCNAISRPMSSEKTLTRIKKLIKKAAKDPKANMLYGFKSVNTGLRRDVKGVVFLSGDIQQIDSVAHIPAICEEKDLPYIWVTSQYDLCGGKIVKSPIMLVKPNEEYKDAYDKVLKDIKKTPLGY